MIGSKLVELCEKNLNIFFIFTVILAIPGVLIGVLVSLPALMYFLFSYSIYLFGILLFFAIPLIDLIIAIWAFKNKRALLLFILFVIQVLFLFSLLLLL